MASPTSSSSFAIGWPNGASVCGGLFEFLEAYFNCDIDIIGEHGLRRLVNIGYRAPFGNSEHPITFCRRRLLEWQPSNKDCARAKCSSAHHYALPTEFFHLLLGDTYGYGEGHWGEDTRTLDLAQHNNFDLICQMLRLSQGDKLVEVDPGWGWMAMLAAQKYGADVTFRPITLRYLGRQRP